MAQLNYDSSRGASASDGFTTSKTSGPLTLSGVAALSFDSAMSRHEIMEALRAARRAVGRAFQSIVLPSDLPTSGSSIE
jgi:hypothetical protein